MDIGIGCRHRDVEWHDAHHCTCHECGKVGEWFDDGFTLWRRTKVARVAEASPDNRLLEFPMAATTAKRQAS